MKTMAELVDELYQRGADAERHALVLVRCLDYDRDLVLDDAGYRQAVRTILDALDQAVARRTADLRATIAKLRGES